MASIATGTAHKVYNPAVGSVHNPMGSLSHADRETLANNRNTMESIAQGLARGAGAEPMPSGNTRRRGGDGSGLSDAASHRNPDGTVNEAATAGSSSGSGGTRIALGFGRGGGGGGESAAPRMSAGFNIGQDYRRQQLESNLIVQEARARQEYFDALRKANERLANIGPDQKFYKEIEKRLLQLDRNPDSVINTNAYKQYKDSLMRSNERRQNAIGRSSDEEAMARAESFIRQGYIGELRNFYAGLLGQTTPLKQAGLQGLNQATQQYMENLPIGQMFGAVNALGQAGRGIDDPGAMNLLRQVHSTLQDFENNTLKKIGTTSYV